MTFRLDSANKRVDKYDEVMEELMEHFGINKCAPPGSGSGPREGRYTGTAGGMSPGRAQDSGVFGEVLESVSRISERFGEEVGCFRVLREVCQRERVAAPVGALRSAAPPRRAKKTPKSSTDSIKTPKNTSVSRV